jgi:hypothetical protein
MKIRIQAKLHQKGKYFPAILTNEHSETSCGLPVVVIDGEKQARKPGEVFCITGWLFGSERLTFFPRAKTCARI